MANKRNSSDSLTACPRCYKKKLVCISGIGFAGESWEEEYRCSSCGCKVVLIVGEYEDLEEDHKELVNGGKSPPPSLIRN